MKLTKKQKKHFVAGILPMLNRATPSGIDLFYICKVPNRDARRNPAYGYGSEAVMHTKADLPHYVNHKRRLLTLARQCATAAELTAQTKQYVATYPA